MSDYKPSPLYKSPFSIAMGLLILVVLIAFGWAEWGSSLNTPVPASTSVNPPTPKI